MKPPGMTRLAMRFLRANGRRNIVLGAAIAVAVFTALLLENIGLAVVDQLEVTAQRRYGTAQITLPGGEARILAGGSGWITEGQAGRIAEILRIDSVSVHSRIQADAILVSGYEFATVRIISSRDGRPAGIVFGDPPSPARPAHDPPSPAEPQSLLIGSVPTTLGDNTAPAFIDLGEAGVSWVRDQDIADLVWVSEDELMRVLRGFGVAPENAVGNVLLIDPDGGTDSPDSPSPAVVAYNATEILLTEFPGVEVHSRLDIAGRTAEISAENIPLLLSLVLILPAIAAIVGSVLVTGEARSEELVLLRTMGFDTPTIRALMVREIFMVAAAATLVALVSAVAVTLAVPNLAIVPKSLVRFAFIGGFIPPGISFLTARRLLARRIHEQLAEFRR